MLHNMAQVQDWGAQNPKLNTDEAAEYLGVAPATLSIWRCTGRYVLPYLKIGRKVLYLRSDLDRFISSHRMGDEASGGL